MEVDRFLLCRPDAGLNDQLCQIEKCCQYAERYNRKVIIDTNYAGSHAFHDDYSNYFVSRQSRLLLNGQETSIEKTDKTIFPEFLTGKLQTYKCFYDSEKRVVCESETRQPITFDFLKDYEQNLLVHHQVGGTNEGIFALLRIKLREELQQTLLERLNQIQKPFIGVHIRNTDYTTNYRDIIKQIQKNQTKNIFLATDSMQVLHEFQNSLPSSSVVNFSRHLSNNQHALHYTKLNPIHTRERNIDAILDLVMLSLSSNIIIPTLNPNIHSSRYSGYSILALQLWRFKPILRDFIGASNLRLGLD